jgi:hypothetical protein
MKETPDVERRSSPEDARSRNGGSNVGPRPAREGRPARGFTLAAWLEARRKSELVELFRFWADTPQESAPPDEERLRRHLAGWMSEPTRVEARVRSLGQRLTTVIDSLMGSPRYQKSWGELSETPGLGKLSPYELEACITALARRGFVVEGDDRRFERFGERVLGLPLEVGDGLSIKRRESRAGVFSILSLRGHLEELYSSRTSSPPTPRRLRELYKMYSQETACIARIERLPDGLRELVEKAILEFGGLLPRAFFERTESKLTHWNARRWNMVLEQSLVGTVRELDLLEHGIALQDETLVVFNEVSLAWLRRVAVPGDPDRPHEELSLGIDLTSNISRFLAYLQEHGVRFTVRGEIFKTTEKRILQHLIPNPGRELSRDDVLRFIFRFTRQAGLIDRTGNRTFSVTSTGREWERLPLAEKQRLLLEYALQERSLSGESLHQIGLRSVFLRYLKRVEPQTWYDLMYLPFVARSTYLANLDDGKVAELLGERASSGRTPALEDPQRMAWNLIRWVRERLYLLGVVDLGYDKSKRPVAMRLTAGGARLLGVEEMGAAPSAGTSLVITPDFEVVLFPSGDDGELIHGLDRFCVREKQESLLHFRVTQESVARALRSGLALADLMTLLESHARTPVPQNVAFSIRDWALQAGLMRLRPDLVLVCEQPDVLRRFTHDAGVKRHLAEVLDERTVRLKGRITPRRMQALLRDLGYIVELEEAPEK